MKILAFYLSRLIGARAALVLGVLVALALAFDLLERSDDVLGNVPLDYPLLRYALLRLPEIAGKMLPVAALVGALLAYAELLRHRELAALWNTGSSPWNQIRFLLPLGLVLAGLQFAIADRLLPPTLATLERWNLSDIARRSEITDEKGYVWMRDGADIVRFQHSAETPRRLEDVWLFRRDGEGRLVETVRAEAAERDGGGWRMIGVSARDPRGATLFSVPTWEWPSALDPAELDLARSAPETLSLGHLSRLAETQAFGTRPAHLYETWWHYRMAGAFAPMLLVLLVVVMAQRFGRVGIAARLALGGLACGFGYLIFEMAALSLGEAGLLPPLLASWGPPVILASVIASFARRTG